MGYTSIINNVIMQNIIISVIMPVYNSGIYLKPAIDSVLSQDFDGFELILVDDGSTDDSGKICDYYADIDSRVVVIHKANGGICNARNRALQIAKGTYVTFADHDDVYKPGLLSAVYQCVALHEVDFVKFSKEYMLIDGAVVKRTVTDVISPGIIEKNMFSTEVCILITEWALDCVWDGLYRMDTIRKNNILFDERFKKGGEDIAFNIRYLCYCNRMEKLSEVYYTHFIRKGFSTSSKYSESAIEDQICLTEIVFDSLIELNFDFELNKEWYTFYLVRNLYCIVGSKLSNPNCIKTISEKNMIIDSLKSNRFVPDYFFCVSWRSIFQYSKKNGFAFLFLKHRLYRFFYMLFSIRRLIPSITFK